MTDLTAFEWKCQPEAAHLLENILQKAVQSHKELQALSQALEAQTSTRLFDWVDHLIVPYAESLASTLDRLGFEVETAGAHYHAYHHPGAKLPMLVLQEKGHGVAIGVENIADFLMVHNRTGLIEGSPCSPYRRCLVSKEGDIAFWLVERRGNRGLEPVEMPRDYLERYTKALELWKKRPRLLADESQAISESLSLAEQLTQLVERDVAACIVLEVERDYWERRNRAGQVQKDRQDQLGMGWANHDHHTFRSSRKAFTALVQLFEILGFHCRERFYAGTEAGWGAQVMENSRAGLVLFLDVDLADDEVVIDFAHQPLPERDKLGTIGLWCALHGDSILQAGMHHLEAQFSFEELASDLAQRGFKMMEPFSSFSYLKQAFTEGERWSVEPGRIELLLNKGQITPSQADRFRTSGAIGSHMENLQRREGYKGFNQKNVSFIIRKTDPRTAHTETLRGD